MKFLIKVLIFFIPCSFVNGADLSFMDAVNEIVKRDPRISIDRTQIETQKTIVLAKKTSFLPTVNITAYEAKNLTANSDTTFVGGGLDLNLYRFGYNYYDLKSEQYALQSYHAQKNTSRLKIEQEGASKLIRAIHQKSQVDIIKKIIGMKEKSVSVAKSRYKRGLAPKSEVSKALIDLDNAHSNLNDAKRTLISYLAAVKVLLGHQNVVFKWPMLNFILNDAPGRILQKELQLGKRPDYQQALHNIESANYQRRKARSLLLPSFDFDLDRSLTETASGRTWASTATISITIPIFDGLTNYASYKTAKNEVRKLRYSLKRNVRILKSDFESARDIFKTSVEDVKKRQQTLNLSRVLYETNFKKFRQGRISINELNWDQDRLFRSESLWAKAVQSAHLNLVDLCQNFSMALKHCLEI